ncbi:LIM domain-containing protein PLIM2b-like [Phragmites australis]|uniref:LIM domain-containing protein PLIM2b-like n=1 Tax=Phragmites australis TaxID=29695 RepID=UPI002D79DE83|nr:LIM domain-containing protein PLIM2b-like [Phragmites australis]
MSFTGTQDKCKTCDKTVHFIDLLTADGVSYHKICFKCSHCKGNLSISNYSSMDGVLYCKTHFEQLFKETGTFSKKFQGGASNKNDQAKAPSKLSSAFCGTQDKCTACQKTVYPLEKLTLEGESYHKSCFKCSHGGCILTTSSYAALNGILYCKIHFSQLFKEKGSYNHLIQTAQTKKSESVEAAPEPPVDVGASEQEVPPQVA